MSEPLPALLSIHDVMPETLDRVEAILRLLQENHLYPCTLLVVPGKEWSDADLDRLRVWSEQGKQLAAHGWKHKADKILGGYHRLHSLLFSRGVAEHLERNSDGILALMGRSGAWFKEVNLPSPALYVPPAWALGCLREEDAPEVPFPLVETLSGLSRFSAQGRRRRRLPLCGYEADTAGRALFLRAFNAGQRGLARRSGRPLRLSIHPDDLSLRLGTDLRRDLRRALRPLSYEATAPA